MNKKITSFDGTVINYDKVHKSEKYLVFIHGAGGNLTAWDDERRYFHKKNYSTIAIDLRGHGLSGKPPKESDYTLQKFTKDIYQVIKHEKINNFIIIGHCFGGMITIIFHHKYPDLAKSYILVDTTYKSPTDLTKLFHTHKTITNLLNSYLSHKVPKKIFTKEENYKPYIGTSDLYPKRILDDIQHTSFKSWLFTYENISKFNGVKILKSIKKPVLIIEGKKDSIFPVLIAKKIKHLVKKSKLDLVPNANHIIVLNNPTILEKEMYSFIKQIY